MFLRWLYSSLCLLLVCHRIALAVSDDEMAALQDFYYATSGDHWYAGGFGAEVPWDFSGASDPCVDEWYGIDCNDTAARCDVYPCSITELNMASTALDGSLPNSIGQLRSMQSLYLGSNNLRSTIPSTIGEMADLQYINLRGNSFSGQVPSSIGNLSDLKFLSLRENSLEGPLPSSIATLANLQAIMLDYNRFSGKVFGILGSLPDMEILGLSFNQFSGSLPSLLGNLNNKITTLLLQKNCFTGSIPSSIGSCTAVTVIAAKNNFFSGVIPSSIGNLVSSVGIDLSFNCLTGSIPSSVGSLSRISGFFVDFNRLTGPIPSTIGGMCAVSNLILSSNFLTGTIPNSILTLSELIVLNMESNFIHGPIPDLQRVLKLRSISLAGNAITGSIPSSLALASRLTSIHMSQNLITGSLPFALGSLTRLQDLSLDSNLISGPLPGNFFDNNLRLVLMQENYLSGSIPSVDRKESSLQYWYMYSNLLSGTLPNFSQYNILSYLLLYDNRLSGTLPSSLASIFLLTQLQLQDNEFSGNPTLDFRSTVLETIDFSRNRFSGTVPKELFSSIWLKNLVLSLNCFEGGLSNDLCHENSSLTMISMDGLRSGAKCGLTRRFYAQTMDGTIPECLFQFSSLKTLSIAGNGFFGTVIGSLPSSSVLIDLTLSHNRLTGTLSKSMQTWPFNGLDLSYNRLTGSLQYMSEAAVINPVVGVFADPIFRNVTNSIILKENRFSGDLPTDFRRADTVDILVGNMFACDSLPEDDRHYEFYSCGSSSLNSAMITWGVLIRVVLIAVVSVNMCYAYRSHRARHKIQDGFLTSYILFLNKQLRDIWKYVEITSPSKSLQSVMPQLSMFIMLLYEIRRIAIFATCFAVLIIGSIVLVLKIHGLNHWDHVYPTYVNQYSWKWSASYLGGLSTAIVFAVVWCIAICVYVFVVAKHAWDRHKVSEAATHERMSILPPKRSLPSVQSRNSIFSVNNRYLYLFVLGIVLTDLFVVFIVNAVYVRIMLTEITRAEIFFIQVALTAFNVSWNKLVCVLITRFTEKAATFLKSFQHFLLLFILLVNNVLAPVFSSIIVDSSCFRSIILGAEEIDSVYQYNGCSMFYTDDGGKIICSTFSDLFFKYSYKPSYIYNYECTSSVISNYIPILLFVYLVQSILFPVLFAVLSSLRYASIPSFFAEQLPGFLWPNDVDRVGRKLIPSAELLASTRSHLTVLFTFGMVSPPLAIAVTFAIVVNIYRWQIYIGRYMVHTEFRASMFISEPIDESKSEEIRNVLNRVSADGRKVSTTEMIDLCVSSKAASSVCLEDAQRLSISSSSISDKKSLVSDYTLTSCTNIENSLTEMSAGYRSCVLLVLFVCNIFFSCVLVDMAGDEVGFRKSLSVCVVIWAVTIILSVYVIGLGYFQEAYLETAPDVASTQNSSGR